MVAEAIFRVSQKPALKVHIVTGRTGCPILEPNRMACWDEGDKANRTRKKAKIGEE